MVVCPCFHAENRDDSKFCGNCGLSLGAGAEAGPEAASLTKTFEILVRVLKPGALIAGKYRMRLSRDRHCEWGTRPH